jgi:hypothetical protein
LRDLSAAGPRQRVAPIAEQLTRRWLDAFGKQVHEAAWRPELWGRRILFWGCHAPLIMSADDLRGPVLNALNRGATDYPDMTLDGRIGPAMLAALDAFLARRKPGGEIVLLKAIEALQGERYVALAETRPANEAFLYGWLANRL